VGRPLERFGADHDICQHDADHRGDWRRRRCRGWLRVGRRLLAHAGRRHLVVAALRDQSAAVDHRQHDDGRAGRLGDDDAVQRAGRSVRLARAGGNRGAEQQLPAVRLRRLGRDDADVDGHDADDARHVRIPLVPEQRLRPRRDEPHGDRDAITRYDCFVRRKSEARSLKSDDSLRDQTSNFVLQTSDFVLQTSRWCLVAVAAFLALGLSRAAAGSITTCEAANPFDHQPDDIALQACLDSADWVLLKPDYLPGYVGYIISDTLKIRHDGVLLTTSDNPHKVTLVADPELSDAMLRVTSANDYEI